jgi:putative heme-binding domain-containing protein
LKPVLDLQPESRSPSQALAARTLVKQWTADELVPIVERGLRGGRNFERVGACMARLPAPPVIASSMTAARWHLDLTAVASRFGVRDLLEAIVLPSKAISDQYAAIVIRKKNGEVVTGPRGQSHGPTVSVVVDMLEPGKFTDVRREDIESMEPARISMMPPGLLNSLKPDEIQDLVAYLLARRRETPDVPPMMHCFNQCIRLAVLWSLALPFTLGAARWPRHPADATNGFVAILMEKSLNNWDGDPAFWRVEDGVIVAEHARQTRHSKHLPYLAWWRDERFRTEDRLPDDTKCEQRCSVSQRRLVERRALGDAGQITRPTWMEPINTPARFTRSEGVDSLPSAVRSCGSTQPQRAATRWLAHLATIPPSRHSSNPTTGIRCTSSPAGTRSFSWSTGAS